MRTAGARAGGDGGCRQLSTRLRDGEGRRRKIANFLRKERAFLSHGGADRRSDRLSHEDDVHVLL